MSPTTTPKLFRDSLHDWFNTNTFTPDWLPKRLQHPVSAYVGAVLIQVVAIVVTIGLVAIAPDFTFKGAFILLGVIGVAFILGGAPGLLASLVGATMLDFFLVPPLFSLSLNKGGEMLSVMPRSRTTQRSSSQL